VTFLASVADLRFEFIRWSLFLKASFRLLLGLVELLIVLVDKGIHIKDNICLDNCSFLLIILPWAFQGKVQFKFLIRIRPAVSDTP